VGILASGIVDVVETCFNEKSPGHVDGPVVGSAVVNDNLTLLLDADELLKLAANGHLKHTGVTDGERPAL
jgi:hypothetical protein